MNKEVSFPIGKLLNSKGLPGIKSFYDNKKHYELNPKKYTIVEVVMWLYEKHGIWISVSMENNENDKISFYYSITENIEEETYFRKRFSNFNSPTEAYEAAIEYTLNNLTN